MLYNSIFLIWAVDLFLFCFRMKMTIIVLKNKTRNKADSRVDLRAVGVVFKEDVTRVVVAVLEADAVAIGVGVGTTMVIRVGVGATMVIRVDVGATVVIGVVAVVLGAVVVVLGAVVVVVSRVENLGVETKIATDQENHGEIMTTVIKEVLRVVLIEDNLSTSQHHVKIKESFLTINIK